jgi:hypothetical protein
MSISLDKQYGPFPLKIWLIIGAGGIGAGLLVARHLSSSQGVAGGETGKGSQPAPVIFTRVIIGLEHVPGVDDIKPDIKPPVVNPIMPSHIPTAAPIIKPINTATIHNYMVGTVYGNLPGEINPITKLVNVESPIMPGAIDHARRG